MTRARDIVDQFNNNGFHHIQTKTVASDSAGADVFYFLNAFSSDFSLYYVKFKVHCDAHSLSSEVPGFQLGNSGSVVAGGEEYETGVTYNAAHSSTGGNLAYHSEDGVIIIGNNVGTSDTSYEGYINIANPVSSSIDTTWWGSGALWRDDVASTYYYEMFGGRQDVGDTFGATDFAFRVFAQATGFNQSATTITGLNTKKQSIYGTVILYGCKGL